MGFGLAAQGNCKSPETWPSEDSSSDHPFHFLIYARYPELWGAEEEDPTRGCLASATLRQETPWRTDSGDIVESSFQSVLLHGRLST